MTDQAFETQVEGGVARLTLTREDRHNAFDDALIAALEQQLAAWEADASVRVVVLAARGKSFSAGADLNWMRRMADNSEAENLADARSLAGLMRRLAELPKPTLALVQGPAYGGGVGLVACCDIALATSAARFALTEVRLGIIPSVIAPYVLAALGPRAAKRFMLTGEVFSAKKARRLGLVHEIVATEDLEARGTEIVAALLACGPRAQGEVKSLVRAIGGRPVDDAMIEDTAQRIARVRASAEGREGLSAFLEKRKTKWVTER